MDEHIPAVTVVIPVYSSSEERESYLEEALQSVANQTIQDFEVVLIDDASPRDIAPVLTRFSSLPGLRVIRNRANLGHIRTRNLGVQSARSEFIAFLDHDDIWHPSKLELQLMEFSREEDAGMIFTASEIIGTHAHRLNINQDIMPHRPSFRWLINHGNYVITFSSALVRKSVLLEIGLFDERYSSSDDFDAWLKIVRRRPLIYMPQRLTGYRLHAENENYGVDRLNDNRLITALLIDYWRTAPFNERVGLLPRIARKLVGRVYFRLFRHRKFTD